jgi:hypothetical protein
MSRRSGGTAPARSSRPKAPDARLITTSVDADTVVDGVMIEQGSWVVQIGTFDVGHERYWFHVPEPVAFFLIEAAKHRTAGERRRRKLLAEARADSTGFRAMPNSPAVLDAVSNLTLAVQLSLSAIEAHANGAIADMPDDGAVDVERGGATVTIAKPEMERQLDLREKLASVVPLAGGKALVRGSAASDALDRLVALRDELVHVKQRREVKDSHDPGPFMVLLRGAAGTCVEDAVAVIDATEPDWLNGRVRDSL